MHYNFFIVETPGILSNKPSENIYVYKTYPQLSINIKNINGKNINGNNIYDIRNLIIGFLFLFLSCACVCASRCFRSA